MSYLIICDPSGAYSARLIESGVSPADITVYEDTHKGQHTCAKRGVTVTDNLDDLKGMRFDVIFGNPPYSDRSSDSDNSVNLDSVFYLRATELGDRVSLIIREKHFNNKNSQFRKRLFSSGRVESITAIPDDTFPILNTQTCIVTWSVHHRDTTRITYRDGSFKDLDLSPTTTIKLDNPNFVQSVPNNLADRWIRGRLSRGRMRDGADAVVEIMGRGDSPVIRHIESGLEDTARDCHGVVMNVAAEVGGLGRIHIKPFGAAICGSVVCLRTETAEQAVQLRDYLMTPEVKQIVKDNMAAFAVTKTLCSRIPSPF